MLSSMQARVMQHLPGKPFTYDNYLSMKQDNVCQGEFPPVFGIQPASIEAVATEYLQNGNMRGRYQRFRRQARHTE